MKWIRPSFLIPLLCVVCVSCVSARKIHSSIETLNSAEESVPCVVFENDEMLLSEENMPVVTPAKVEIEASRFSQRGRGSGHVRLGVRPVKLIPDGKVVGGLSSGESLPYLEERRSIAENDATKQLFILRRNKNYIE